MVLDILSTHTTPDVQAWFQANPRLQFHFTPKGSSWMNQIETWFGIITIRRDTFSSVQVLVRTIRISGGAGSGCQAAVGPPFLGDGEHLLLGR